MVGLTSFEFAFEPHHTGKLRWLLTSDEFSVATACALLEEEVLAVEDVALERCLAGRNRRPDLRFSAVTDSKTIEVAVEIKVDSDWRRDQLRGEADIDGFGRDERGLLLSVGATSLSVCPDDFDDRLRRTWTTVSLERWRRTLQMIGADMHPRLTSYFSELAAEIDAHHFATEWAAAPAVGPPPSNYRGASWLPAKAWLGLLLNELGSDCRAQWSLVHGKKPRRKCLVPAPSKRSANVLLAFEAGEYSSPTRKPALELRIRLRGNQAHREFVYPIIREVCERNDLECAELGSTKSPKTIGRFDLGNSTPGEAVILGERLLEELRALGAFESSVTAHPPESDK